MIWQLFFIQFFATFGILYAFFLPMFCRDPWRLFSWLEILGTSWHLDWDSLRCFARSFRCSYSSFEVLERWTESLSHVLKMNFESSFGHCWRAIHNFPKGFRKCDDAILELLEFSWRLFKTFECVDILQLHRSYCQQRETVKVWFESDEMRRLVHHVGISKKIFDILRGYFRRLCSNFQENSNIIPGFFRFLAFFTDPSRLVWNK